MAVPYSITKQNSQLSGKVHYYATPQLYGTKTTKEIGKLIAAKTTVTLPDVYAVLYALSEAMTDVLQSGYQAELDGIGKMRVSLKSTNADSYEEFTGQNIVGAKVKLLPSSELKSVYDGMEFEFVPNRETQAIAKKAAKEGKTISVTTAASSGSGTGTTGNVD